jgi:hypothetical protein
VDDFKWLMGHKQGRRFMWRLLGFSGLYRNPFVAGDSGQRDFNCGMQNVGQHMLHEIHALCPENYELMVKEYQAWLVKTQA